MIPEILVAGASLTKLNLRVYAAQLERKPLVEPFLAEKSKEELNELLFVNYECVSW